MVSLIPTSPRWGSGEWGVVTGVRYHGFRSPQSRPPSQPPPAGGRRYQPPNLPLLGGGDINLPISHCWGSREWGVVTGVCYHGFRSPQSRPPSQPPPAGGRRHFSPNLTPIHYPHVTLRHAGLQALPVAQASSLRTGILSTAGRGWPWPLMRRHEPGAT